MPRFLLILLLALGSLGSGTTQRAAASQAMQLSNTGTADAGYVSVPNQAALQLQAFTAEMWIRPLGPGYGLTTNVAGATLFAKPQQGAVGIGPLSYHMGWNPVTSQLYFLLVNAPPNVYADFSSAGLAALNTWTHVAFSFDGTSMRIFINGVLDNSRSYPYAGVYYGTEPITLGAGNYGSGYLRRFQGDMSDVRLWNYARHDYEIAAQMNCPLSGTEPGLVANWKLDGDLLDATSLHADGTAGGAVGYISPAPWSCALDVAPGAAPAGVMSLVANPSPFRSAVDFTVQLPRAGRTTVDVFAVDGTRVVRLADEVLAGGRHAYRWDGSDALGHRSPPGLYWVRAASGGYSTTHAIVRLD
jgi:hypothetical protein